MSWNFFFVKKNMVLDVCMTCLKFLINAAKGVLDTDSMILLYNTA